MAPAAKPRMGDTVHATLQAFRAGESVDEIARRRGLTTSTIYAHLSTAIEAGQAVDWERLVTVDQQRQIAAAFARTGFGNLTGAMELLGEGFAYGMLRIFRAVKNAEQTRM